MQVGGTGSGLFAVLSGAREKRLDAAESGAASASDRIAQRQSARSVTSSDVGGFDSYRETSSGLYLLERLAAAGLATGYMDAVFASAANRAPAPGAVQSAYQEAAAYAE